MGRISSGVGLVSGLAVDDIVKQLMEVESQPRTLVENRVKVDTDRKTALLTLSASLLTVQSAIGGLKSSGALNARTAVSSQPGVLSVTAAANAALGSFQVRSVRQAQTNRLISAGMANRDVTPVGAGTIKIEQGGFVATDTRLDTLNGGAGVRLGKIQITDRSGAKATVDLSTAQTVGDVLTAINQTTGLGVAAAVRGDQITLTDTTGQTSTNISVAEVGGGATGADLGLVGGSFASNTLTGLDVVRLGGSLRLDSLNDGLGVREVEGADDFRITLTDGSTIDVNVSSASTLSDVISLINSDSQNSGNLVASISSDGERLELTDTSGGGGTLAVSALNGSKSAADLGILGSEQGGGVLRGTRLLAGLNSVLLHNLRGGQASITAGDVLLQDRSGANATVDFSGAESLSDVINIINSSGLALAASVNTAGNGIDIVGASGSGSIAISDISGNLAASLGIDLALVDGKSSVGSGDLDLQWIGENTLLSRLNGGAGVAKGQIRITDSTGVSRTVNLSASNIKTVGDVLTAINASGAGVHARINDTGDGIVLIDNVGGSLSVSEAGGTTAASLHLLGSGTDQIDGAFRWQIDVSGTDTLNDVLAKLTGSGAPLTASIANDGNISTPYRLVVSSKNSGAAGRLLLDTGTTGLTFGTLSAASDALLQLGGGSGGVLLSSATNTFTNVLPGVAVTLLDTSSSSATVTVTQDDAALTAAVKQFTTTYNAAVTSIRAQTKFDVTTLTGAILHNDNTAREAEQLLQRIIGQQFGNGSIHTLGDLGIVVSDGQLSVDSDRLSRAIADDPDGVRDFLGNASNGFATTFETQLKNYTSQFNGAISNHVNSIDLEIQNFQARISDMNARLDIREQRLRAQFLGLEQAIAQLQRQQTALSQLSGNISLATSHSSSK